MASSAVAVRRQLPAKIALMMEAVTRRETLVNFYEIAWHSVTEYPYLHYDMLVLCCMGKNIVKSCPFEDFLLMVLN
jgi:hypothetical protein